MSIYYKTNTQIRREAQQRARRFQRGLIACTLLALAVNVAQGVNEWINVLASQGVL